MTILTLNDYHQLEQAAKRLGTAGNVAALKALENTKAYKAVEKFIWNTNNLMAVHPKIDSKFAKHLGFDPKRDDPEEMFMSAVNEMVEIIISAFMNGFKSRDKEYHKLMADRFPDFYIITVTSQSPELFMDIVKQTMQRVERNTKRQVTQNLQSRIAKRKNRRKK